MKWETVNGAASLTELPRAAGTQEDRIFYTMVKKAKVKGYGAYWKGDIKNKTIARKNKQYISDQRCLKVYKKQLQKQTEQKESIRDTISGLKRSKDGPNDVAKPSYATAEYDVKVIKPKVETVYYMPEASPTADENVDESGSGREDDTDEGGSETEVEDGSDSSEVDGDDIEREDALEHSDDEGSQMVGDSNKELGHYAKTSQPSRNYAATTKGNMHGKDGTSGMKVDKRTRKGVAKADSRRVNGKDSNGKGEKFSGVYAKALKIRHERSKVRQQQHEEKLERIKQKKLEIRQKKQQRYARHRLLGNKTKKGQPIMANVISHLMNNFQKKHKLDD